MTSDPLDTLGAGCCSMCWDTKPEAMDPIKAQNCHSPPPHSSIPSAIDLVHDAYRRLSHEQLYLFCVVRSLSTSGNDIELASRLAHHDLHQYTFPSSSREISTNAPTSIPHNPPVSNAPPTQDSHHDPEESKLSYVLPLMRHEPMDSAGLSTHVPAHQSRARHINLPPFPVEIMADIMDHIGDWELCKAVGLPTSLPQPLSWTRASQTDHALLQGYLPLLVASDPAAHPPTTVGATLTVRFGYTNILTYLFHTHRPLFRRLYKHDLILTVAAHYGRVAVLDWWLAMRVEFPAEFPVPPTRAIADAIDGASRAGQVAVLDWWRASGLPFEYTEAALEHASAKNQLDVLEWWRAARGTLPLKVGRVMDTASAAGHVAALAWWAHSGLDFTYDKQALYHASCHGRVDVLQWWLSSGLQLFFEQDVLVGATRHDRPEVLEWWDKSMLPIQYRMCDIEEALEDAIGGGERAREWWKRKGVDFNANDKEWMKVQTLN